MYVVISLDFLCDTAIHVVDFLVQVRLVKPMWYLTHNDSSVVSFAGDVVDDLPHFVDTVLNWLFFDVVASSGDYGNVTLGDGFQSTVNLFGGSANKTINRILFTLV